MKGAEGSTGFIVVNDGILTITTYDKAMTAKWKCYDPDTPSDSDGDRVCNASDPNPFVTINGGSLNAASSGNDGIDANAISNPGITVNGGVVVANGIGAPEEGFGADRYTVALNGGTAIGTGGNNSSVDTSSSADYATISKITSGKTLAIWKGSTSQGSLVFTYQVPSASTSATYSNLGSGTALTVR